MFLVLYLYKRASCLVSYALVRVKIGIRLSLVSTSTGVRLLKLTESVLYLLMFVSCLGLLSPLGDSPTIQECQYGFNYLIDTEILNRTLNDDQEKGWC